MTKQTILDYFKDINEAYNDSSRYDSLSEMLDELLQGPKAEHIIRKQMKQEYPDGSIEYYAEWHCPHCNSVLQRGFENTWLIFCPRCSQPILWGDE